MARRRTPSNNQLGLIFLVPPKASGQPVAKHKAAPSKKRSTSPRKKAGNGSAKKGKSRRASAAPAVRTYTTKKGHRYELVRRS